jgi:DNA recombination protein RmuC
MDLTLIVLIIAVFLLIILIARTFSIKNTGNTEQIIDLKNQINDLKTKQIEAHNASLLLQQKLYTDSQKVLTEQVRSLLDVVNNSLNSSQKNINSQLANTNQVISDVKKELGALGETAKNMHEIGKDISSLQEILRAPKLRGNLGEYLLEELLKEIFPSKNYEMKYSFKDGTQVDAVIKLGEGIVPVDSKFPLESFQRLVETKDEVLAKQYKKEFVKSVKTRIDEIASKYINPGERTFDFAMMYIPAENVFYETIINDTLTNKEYEIFNYAVSRHVIPVSPNSFYAYLMALVYGLKGFKIEQEAKTIIGELSKVQSAFGRFYEDYSHVGRHLKNAVSKFQETEKRADRLNDKIFQITKVNVELVSDDEKSIIKESNDADKKD